MTLLITYYSCLLISFEPIKGLIFCRSCFGKFLSFDDGLVDECFLVVLLTLYFLLTCWLTPLTFLFTLHFFFLGEGLDIIFMLFFLSSICLVKHCSNFSIAQAQNGSEFTFFLLVSVFLFIYPSFFFFSFLGHQERLKKVKSELGKAQLGNITVDMVMFYVNSCLVEVNYCSFLVQVLNIAVSFKYF